MRMTGIEPPHDDDARDDRGQRLPDLDPATTRFVEGCLRALLWGGVFWLCVAAAAAMLCSARAQTLVSIQRADYDRGVQHVECWLVPRAAAAQYATGTLVVDCGSDPDRIFHNGFESPDDDAEAAP